MQGSLAPIVARLRAETEGDIWLLGGAAVAQACLALGLVDTLELFLIPVTLGAGVRLFAPNGTLAGWALMESQPFPNGVLGVTYRRA